MIKQEPVELNGVKIMLVVNTDEKSFCLFNTKSKNKKGNSRASFQFFKSNNTKLCINVAECIKKAVLRAEEIINLNNK